MPSTIHLRLHEFRRRIRSLLGVYGCCCLIGVLIGVIVACGLADWLLDLSTGVRTVLLGIVVMASGWSAFRYLIMPLAARMRDIDLALRVESQFPHLQDQLASAVEFLDEPSNSSGNGSASLREAVIEQASRNALAIDFAKTLDARPAKRAATYAGTIVAIGLILLLVSPGNSRIALARLANPFGSTSWPRETHLVIVDPPNGSPVRLARGEPFHLMVQVDRGRVPARAEVFYTFDNGDTSDEPLRAHGDRQFTGGLEAATRSFEFHVRGGDGVTDSRRVEVVPPPELQSLHVRLTYPDYTGKPPEDLPQGNGHVHAVWGTQVDLWAKSSKPLERAELRLANESIPARLLGDGNPNPAELGVSFRVEVSGSYWIAATRDRDGFENREASRYEIRVQNDSAPEVFVERPASDIEVTPSAHVPLHILLKDDFGIVDATLRYSTPRAVPTDASPNDASPAASTPPDTAAEGSTGRLEPAEATSALLDTPIWQSSGNALPKRQVVDHIWRLSELNLSPGSVLTYRVVARDADNLRGPNLGQSRLMRLLVITAEDLTKRIEDRQMAIFQEMDRVRKLETEARAQVEQVNEQLRQTGSLSKSEVAHIQSAEATQRQITRRLTSPTEGLQNQVDQIRQDLANNKVDNPSVSEQLDAISRTLSAIARDELPAIDQSLAHARKAMESAAKEPTGPANESDPRRASLNDAQHHQDAVLSKLDEMLERMTKWETYRGIARDARELLDQQEQLANQTSETGQKTVGQKKESLPAELQAELARQATRQEQTREQLNRLQRKMDQMSNRLNDSDPLGAGALRDASDNSRQAGTSDQMQRAAQSIQQNQVGAAESAQRQVVDDLKQMIDTIENNREHDLAKIVQKLREAEAKLEQLRQRQLEQLERTADAENEKDPESRRRELEKLARQEKELQQETSRLAQQLNRMRAEKASKSSASASSRMAQAGSQLEQDKTAQSKSEQEKVLEELDRAKETAQARRDAEAELAREQLGKIAETLAQLYERQQAVKSETIDLEQARQSRGNWSRPQLSTLRTLAESQRTLQEDSAKARERLSAAPVFALNLTRAINHMNLAAERLGERKADTETQTTEQLAADRLAQLLEALKQEPGKQGDKEGQEEEQDQGDGEGNGGKQPPDGIPPLAQIKMLKSLQIEINERTGTLAQLRDRAEKLSPAQQTELKSLSEEQGILADLVNELLDAARQSESGDKP